jgi:hypothetical protein
VVAAAEVAAEVGDARPCSELGSDEVSCDKMLWVLDAVELPVAVVTAAA